VAGVAIPWAGVALLILFLARWHRRRNERAEAVASSLP
jgi:hypothetical protein